MVRDRRLKIKSCEKEIPNQSASASSTTVALAKTSTEQITKPKRRLRLPDVAISPWKNEIEDDVSGVALALFENDTHDTKGAMLAGIHNEAFDVTGLTVAGIANSVSGVNGIAIAGFGNEIGDEVNGVVVGGFGNNFEYSPGTVKGISIAGCSNKELNGLAGVAIAGIQNTTQVVPTKEVTGVLIAGIRNRVWSSTSGLDRAENMVGVAIAGVRNDLDVNIRGMSIAGFINGTGKLNGIQVSSIFNETGDDAVGVQVSLVNSCIEPRCILQMGLVNISSRLFEEEKKSAAVQIGLFNICVSAPWYKIFAPVVSIHNPKEIAKCVKEIARGAIQKIDELFGYKLRRICKKLNEEIQKNDIVLGLREENRIALFDLLNKGDEPGLLTKGGAYRSQNVLTLPQDALDVLRDVASKNNVHSTKRIKSLVKMLTTRDTEDESKKQQRQEGARQLAILISDHDVYGRASTKALQGLVKVAIKEDEEAIGRQEARMALVGLGVSEDRMNELSPTD